MLGRRCIFISYNATDTVKRRRRVKDCRVKRLATLLLHVSSSERITSSALTCTRYHHCRAYLYEARRDAHKQ